MQPQPTIQNVTLLTADNALQVELNNQQVTTLSAEFLRVYSPSAEVRGHGNDEGTLQTGKRFVKLIALEPTGRYGVKLVFDDGHNTGIYTWNTLIEYALEHQTLWQHYLERLRKAGSTREPSNRVRWIDSSK